MGNNIPRRASNTKRKATRERSYLRGQERKVVRREANEKRAAENRRLRSLPDVGLVPVDVFRKGGTKRTRVADRPLPQPKGKSSRTVTVRTMRNNRQENYGWSVSCLNCPFHRVFLWEHGFTPIWVGDQKNGFSLDIAYESAVARAEDHICTPSQWVFSEDNYPSPARSTSNTRGPRKPVAKSNVR